MKTLGNILKEIRTDLNLTLQEMGELLNFSSSTICHWEKGIRNIFLVDIINLCNKLNLSLEVTNNDIIITNNTTFKKYTISLSLQKSQYTIIKEEKDFYIVKSYKANTSTENNNTKVIFKSINRYSEEGYSVLYKETLYTPINMNSWFKTIEAAENAILLYYYSVKFPALHKHTIRTNGKILFIEQIADTLSEMGLNESLDILKNIAKKKLDYLKPLENFCISKLGINKGYELTEIILSSLGSTYKEDFIYSYINSYNAFLDSISAKTNGLLTNINQIYALLHILIPDISQNKNFFNFKKEDYISTLITVMDKDIYKYGFTDFRNKVLSSVQL